jgi:hypothetical protein
MKRKFSAATAIATIVIVGFCWAVFWLSIVNQMPLP